MQPFLKWAGGKRWLARTWAEELACASRGMRYLEPFLGSGACFFSLKPSRAILSDLNADLIFTYKAIASDWRKVEKILQRHSSLHSETHYYSTRAGKPADPHELAAWFLYLNRSCFNGIYRVNRKGEFNVPKGDKKHILLSTDDFKATSEILAGARLLCSDFQPILDMAGEGDFVFADPPYTVMHNVNGFVKYNEKIFSWADQVRLANSAKCAAERGARVLITNADHHSVRELYVGVDHEVLGRPSVIGGGVEYRKSTSEIALMLGAW